MINKNFVKLLQSELERIDTIGITKRRENVIEGFTRDLSPKAIIQGKHYAVFNSNDYLGLRFNTHLITAEEKAVETYGAGPGAVRFISGTLQVHVALEEQIAKFHGREKGMIFSSAFAANIAVMSCFLKGQSKDSLLSNEVLVISDELNHRSIIDGIRAASIGKDQKTIYRHLDYTHLAQILEENKTVYKRCVIVTDGVFSMLGEYADIGKLRTITDAYNTVYEQGVLFIIDDSHGVGAFGENGRGCEDVLSAKADILIGTFGKAFGSDGGYAVADAVCIDYLRESSATYIYSNPISPSVAASALAAVMLMGSAEGKKLLHMLSDNIAYFKTHAKEKGFTFAANSIHPIQPLLIGDTIKTKKLKEILFENGILVTNINYPVVTKGRDEIRIQISATHTRQDIDAFLTICQKVGSQLKIFPQ